MLSKTVASGDWKVEKHVPVIEFKKNGDKLEIEISVGKEISHPNTPEHHIAWIELYFHPEVEKYPVMVGRVEFTNHSDPLYIKTNKKGKLYALSYCNFNSVDVE